MFLLFLAKNGISSTLWLAEALDYLEKYRSRPSV